MHVRSFTCDDEASSRIQYRDVTLSAFDCATEDALDNGCVCRCITTHELV